MSNQPLVADQQYEYPEQDPLYQGDPVDKRLEAGVIEDRGCTNCFWCIIYLAYWAALIAVAIFAFTQGDPKYIFEPYMNESEQCGVDEQSNCPYLYISYTNTTVGTTTQNFYCVSSCPSSQNQQLVCCNNEQCPTAQYGSQDYMMICQPNSDEEWFWNTFNGLVSFSASEADVQDLSKTWPISLFVCITALILSLFVMVIIRYFAACLVWAGLIIYLLLLVTFGFLFYYSSKGDFSNSRFGSQDSGWMETLAITNWCIAGISLIFIGCYYKRIHLAVAVIKAAADFTRDVCGAIFVPLAMFGVMIGFFVFWIYSTTYLLACGDSSYSQYGFPTIQLQNGVIGLSILNFFGFYWNCQFAMAYCQFVLASCCCMWYFHHMGASLHHPISKSVKRGLLHHSGSLALGSLILTFVFFIRVIFDLIHKCMKDAVSNNKAAEGCCAKCWFGYYGCIIKCFEKFIRFLNQNAYIMMAMTGRSFCKSAHDAFYLISRNKANVAITDGIGEIFTTIGVVFIGALSSFIGFIMVTQISHFSDQISSPVLPTVFFAFLSLVIASIFMNVYGMGVDSILMCYMADEELFKHSGGAKSVPPALKEFLATYYK